jgi:putative oxidoreductase
MATKTSRSFMTWALWIAQALLALLFLMSGVSKLLSPVDLLGDQFAPLPGTFMRFIGAIEVLGAVGLILPALLRILPFLTPLAAAGLLVDMVARSLP